ncbi:transcription factor bHLH25-like protein [Trifolium pratense]|uniref:Transcription factor bHLH25-like protein n=1 Tax=Trifolium pratense TaxID=57577 RepID=A0A2K3NV70_TRIPR|nr:transcription factor bHLH25-like protein [Trifolium pratense]
MEDWWENWFSDLDMDMDINKSFNECQRNSPKLGHCSFDSGTDAAIQGTKRVRSSWEMQDHIMSERKRRHEMAERFIQLSSIIPGLKKIDKASVLGEAINHVKQLKQRISMLEEQQSFERKRLLEVEAIGIESEKELLISVRNLKAFCSNYWPYFKMGKEYRIKEEELVKKLRQDLLKLFDMQHLTSDQDQIAQISRSNFKLGAV